MTSTLNTNVIWIVMKRENVENFEGNWVTGVRRLPDKAFVHIEDALNYIKEQEPVVIDCWKLVQETLDHAYDYGIERHLVYEATHNGHTYYKDIYYDIIPEELID